MMVHSDLLADAIREFLVTLVDDSRTVLRAERRVALAGERPAHEIVPWRAARHFAAVFEFVTLSDRRLYFKGLVLFKERRAGVVRRYDTSVARNVPHARICVL